MRYRITIETDVPPTVSRGSFRESILNAIKFGLLAKIIPGTIVYVAAEIADDDATVWRKAF